MILIGTNSLTQPNNRLVTPSLKDCDQVLWGEWVSTDVNEQFAALGIDVERAAVLTLTIMAAAH
jgi:hypothetical protein